MKDNFGQFFGFSAAEQRGFLGGNALCFLGLVKNTDGSKPKNRQRLEKFRSIHNLSNSVFAKIDLLGLVC